MLNNHLALGLQSRTWQHFDVSEGQDFHVLTILISIVKNVRIDSSLILRSYFDFIFHVWLSVLRLRLFAHWSGLIRRNLKVFILFVVIFVIIVIVVLQLFLLVHALMLDEGGIFFALAHLSISQPLRRR